MVPGRTTPVSEGERNTPPWAASGTPPSLSRPSLRDIQLQQGKQHGISHSPKTRTTGFSVMSGQGSPSESVGVNRWFKPEIDAPSSIRSIQIEERAMKDLKRFYSSVRILSPVFDSNVVQHNYASLHDQCAEASRMAPPNAQA
ncbi:ankyrin repeat family protein/regulator of chromosome condensation (RCC1) family protein [Forsythia ovata]|uniref:Ankyrin repeat family protein/regulator of chromosome condensation (RCC1) family protein n=1 Tax=Forsythia ovata TaxID=205694 RepID=A0ABD1SR27_9LAMI